MATWSDYLKVMDKKGKAAAWDFAKANFSQNGDDFKAAKRYHEPSHSDWIVSRMRQKAINSVSKAEINRNCQFDGMF